MRVLMIQPSSGQHIGFRYMALAEPLGLEAVAAPIQKEHEVRLIDLNFGESLRATLNDFRPDAVGVAVPFTTGLYQAQKAIREVREFNPGIFTFSGGNHATLLPGDLVDGHVDAAVIGEGELALPQLLRAYEDGDDWHEVPGLAFRNGDGVKFSEDPGLIKDLDSLPFPARDLTSKYREHYFYKRMRPFTTVETARGCPYKCKFCSVWMFHRGRYRVRSAERVFDELKAVETRDVLISDDNFLENIKRVDRIYELVKESGLKKRYGIQARTDTIARHPEIIAKWREIGLYWVLIGFESFREEDLESMNKKNTVEANERAVEVLQEHGLEVQAAFIVDPAYEKKEFRLLGDYIKRLKLWSPQITILTPIPGTQFFKEKWQELTTRDYELFDFLHAVVPTQLPLKEFYKEFCHLYRRVSIGHNFWETLKKPQRFSFRDMKNGIKAINNLLRPRSYLKGHLQNRQP